ncbi:MAG: ABC transporter ATP-binding protein [Candidatus Heimdallarchaeota archaeon]|nr:ABC transporter ATP-binding protein [Candidatus Heimdallarchaeota archaeon]MCG3256891.1 ABC transporter ATP-binding protein [Candidatus Heimdallarchaeota archaeon]MCK4611955.1 ABC transporter ATP-binding protein [Candidatus Heimdallarchaeota archaeon]
MTEEIVVCENLSKRFIVGNSVVKAVNGVDLTFHREEFTSVVGPSGSGKTTLLNLIGTLEIPTTGKIIVNGTDLSHFSPADLTEFRRKNLGFVFQFFNLIEGLTGKENVELPMIFDGVPYEERKRRVDNIFKEFEIVHLQNKFPEELSSGERQRVAIMRALINEPILLLADEPTGNLDTNTGQTVLELFKQLNEERGTSIALVTHDLSAAKRAKRILHMHDGKITFDQQNLDEEPKGLKE